MQLPLLAVRAALAAALVLWAGAAVAAQPPSEPAVDTAELEALVATLEDETTRAELVARIRALVEARRAAQAPAPSETARGAGARALDALSGRIEAASRDLLAAANGILELPGAIASLAQSARDPRARSLAYSLLWKLLAVIGGALVTEMLARRLLRGLTTALEDREHHGFWTRLPVVIGRALLDLVAIGAFALAAWGLLSLVEPRPTARLVVLALVNASVVSRAVGALARLLLSPSAASLRLLPLGDESASYWAIWARRITATAVYGYFGVEAALLLGLPPGVHGLVTDVLGLVVASMLVVVILQNREPVARALRGRSEDAGGLAGVRRRAAAAWHLLALLYVAGAWLLWAAEVPGGFAYLARATALTALVVALGAGATAALGRVLERVFALGDEVRERFPGLEARANRYLPLVRTAGAWVIWIAVALSVLQAWGLDTFAWLGSETGRDVGGRVVTVLLLVVGATMVWEVAGSVIEHYLARASAGDLTRSARMNTLLPLARKALLVLLVVMVSLTALSELGIDIGPLLAGAGVVGLAVGFGAQTLVKDVITGVFILVEDSIGVGDYVEVGGKGGTVESLSIRTIRLRDIEGNMHTVPFSEVTSVMNYMKDWAYALMNIGVAYRENIDEVMEVLDRIGEEMLAESEYKADILEPLQVQGLHAFGDSAVIIRARIKTKAGMQWAIRREFYLRMKRRFDELDIEIPFPHQTVWFGVDKKGKAPPAGVRLAAATAGVAPATEAAVVPVSPDAEERPVGDDGSDPPAGPGT